MSTIDLNSSSESKSQPFSWPTKCICNLCDCGSHSCYTFNLEETPGDDNNNNRCNEYDYQPRRMNQRGELENEGERISCLAQLKDERYLSSMASDLTRLKRSTPTKHEKGSEDDLLHVLVSRPAIAARPRDNIIFEGDMDLKTTFETSYEALAKMRLDYWKKYQQEQQQSGEAQDESETHLSRNKQKQQQKVSETSNIEDKQQRIGRLSKEDDPSSVSVVSKTGKQRLPKNDHNAVVDSRRPHVSVDQTTRKATQLEPPKRRSPNLKVDNNSSDETVMTRRKRQVNESETGGLKTKIENDTKSISTETTVHQTGQQSKPVMKTMPNQETTTTYIDPDLSPIIVYDANMNRLEKVGIRKRSKYRPSTSLRSGACGLFGDQKEPVVQEARNLEKQQFGPSMASAGLPNIKSAKVDAWSQSPELNSIETERIESSLNARNLNNFRQPNNLTYTDHNLLIESKRKLKDNINMVDHIREHEIVGRSTPNSPRLFPDDDESNLIAKLGDPTVETTQTMQESMENLKLQAQLEEDAAVEEIQKVTSNLNDPKEQHHQQQQQTHGRVSSTNSRDSSRHSKLQRTCQNQNFYLFENEYPEVRDNQLDAGTRSRDSGAKYTRESPHSRVYNNLFRESPDFILTTGKFIEEEAKRFVSSSNTATSSNPLPQNNNHDSRQAAPKHNQFQDEVAANNDDDTNDAAFKFKKQQKTSTDGSQMSNDPYNNSDNIDTDSHFKQLDTNSGCRVRKLNEDYQYVGSQSGHKYFVEKQS